MTELLTGRDLHKSFGLVQALRGASIDLHSGEIVAVMGPSGGGKSTLLHCLAGILVPDAGEVHFAGRRLDQLPDRQRVQLRRSTFGFVFQFGQLVPELPAIENIALPLRLAGIRRRPALAAATDWLHRLDLKDLGARLPGQLSGGQGQRVALARALTADQVMELLVDAAREQSASVIVVTHEARVAAYADRTVLIRDGVDALEVGAA
jgi:putative ABC transport system ATP-binding protein